MIYSLNVVEAQDFLTTAFVRELLLFSKKPSEQQLSTYTES
jgi:hypothetical protein